MQDQDQANLQAVQDLEQENAQALDVNRYYNNIVDGYKNWIDGPPSKRAIFNLQENEYLNATSINTYFIDVQSKRKVQSKAVKKVLYGLNMFVKQEGVTGLLGPTPASTNYFSMINGPCQAVIRTTLTKVERNNKDKVVAKKGCPQQNLPTAIISCEEISKILYGIIDKGNSSWADTASTMSVCAITLMRFENVKKVTLNNLVLLTQYPPTGIKIPHDTEMWTGAENPVDGCVLGIVIPKLNQIKKNTSVENLKSEIVGGYRHKRYERCYHGILSFVILEKLQDHHNISFLSETNVPQGNIYWGTIQLCHYKYDAAYKAIKSAREAAQVKKWLKETHMRYVQNMKWQLCFQSVSFLLTIIICRKAGSDFCTAQGLSSADVRTLTKHKTDVFEKDYMSELSIKAMTTIAGFIPNSNDTYYVPRAQISLDVSKDTITKLLFPSIDRWKQEIKSEFGDNSPSANEFLNNVLPYLASVMFQDGVLWTKKHPNNPAVQDFCRRMNSLTPSVNYSTRCVLARQEIIDLANQDNIRKQHERNTNDALVCELQELKETIRRQEVNMRKQEEMVSTSV